MALKGSTGTPMNIWRSDEYYKKKAKREREKKQREENAFIRRHKKIDPLMIRAKAGDLEAQEILLKRHGIKIITTI
jgi:hypothetical protein